MEKINKIKNVGDLNYKLMVSYEEAKKDPNFKNMVDRINLPDEELMKNTSSIEDSVVEYKNCCNCKNILNCKNKMTGYCYLPSVEDKKLKFSYVACKYKNKLEENNKFLKNVTSIDVPRDIREAKMKDVFTDDKNREEIIKWIYTYIKQYERGTTSKGLFLHGNFGCGKTYLVAAMINELAKKNVKGVMVYWPEYLRSLKSSYSSSSSDEFKNKFNEVKYAEILLIDDLGAEGVTSWSRDEILGTILQYRMQENLPTFITSNLDINELESHLSITTNNKSEKVKARRIIQRINQLMQDMQMIGENNRK